MDWDDFQLFQAVARAGSFGDAAKTLKVGYSTVSRRIENFERKLGATLFIRQHGGLELTTEGQAVLATAGKMAHTAAALERELKGIDKKLEGNIVVTLAHAILSNVLIPYLHEFQAQYPDIRLEFDTSRSFLDVLKGEADIAIRLTDNHEYKVPENLLGLRLPDIHVHAYASRKIAAKIGRGKPPAGAGWIKWDKRINFAKLRAHFDRHGWPVTCAIDDIKAQLEAVKNDVGIGILPCFLADREPAVSRINGHLPTLAALDAWVLAHPDMRSVERIRAFMQFAASCFERNKGLILGQTPRK